MTIRNSNPNQYTLSPECIAYSTFRREWRDNYKTLSQRIRDQKKLIADAYRDDKPTTASNGQSTLASMRRDATNTMDELSAKRADWKALLETGHQWRAPTEVLSAAE